MKVIFILPLYNLILLLCLSRIAVAQKEVVITYPDHKLGPFSASHRFIKVQMAGSGYTYDYHFLPKNDKVKAYNEKGKFIYIAKDREVELAGLYEGRFDGKKGKWAETYGGRYIFLDDLVDIEAQSKASDDAYKEQVWQKKIAMLPKIIVGVIYLTLLGWISYKINRGFGPNTASTTFTSTGGRDSLGRETFTSESSGDTGGCLNIILMIASAVLLLYLNVTLGREFDFLIPLVFISIGVIVVSAVVGRYS